mgnify:FL=1
MSFLAYVAIGANLGEPTATVRAALKELAQLPGVLRMTPSSFYRTAPLGLKNQPDFINAVAALDIADAGKMTPHALLAALFDIEARFGRQRTVPNAPRTLDLDLLLYEDQICHDEKLTLPHPRMHERAFVLMPLVEIAPDCLIPGQGRAKDWLAQCHDQAIEKQADGCDSPNAQPDHPD